MPDPSDLNRFLPLTPVAFEILLALAEGEGHGYAILRRIERRTGGNVSPHAGTLYRAIARLVDDGLLDALEEAPPGFGGDERRRYYGLTPLGRDVAAAEARRLEDLVLSARERELLAPRHTG